MQALVFIAIDLEGARTNRSRDYHRRRAIPALASDILNDTPTRELKLGEYKSTSI
jgi:hypothetical protein